MFDTVYQLQFPRNRSVLSSRPLPSFGNGKPWLNQPIRQTSVVFLDLETTGLTPGIEDVTEIAAYRYQNGEIIQRLATLVKPNQPISAQIESITGISNAMVQNAPSQRDALSQLSAFIQPTDVLAGDFIDFDMAHLKAKLPVLGLNPEWLNRNREEVVCTRTLEERLKGLGQKAFLDQLKASLPERPKHRAENDVQNAADLLYAILSSPQPLFQNLVSVQDYLALQGKAFRYQGR
jgi:DNA polymerase III alpha subunit (gram-positive type)